MRNVLAIIVLFSFGALLAPNSALAHAHLSTASPKVGSTVGTAPKEIVLTFTEQLEPKFSSIEVRDQKGAAVQSDSTHASGTEMRVALKPLPPGTYKVIWRVLSVDTHRTQGSFTFRVGR
jgi:methionine-rich copper-binding protein CopC